MQSHLNSIMEVILKWLRRAVYLLMGFIIFYGFLNQFLLPAETRNWLQIFILIIFAVALIVFTYFTSKMRFNDMGKLGILLSILGIFIVFVSLLVYRTNPFGVAFLGLIAVLSVISYKLTYFLGLNSLMIVSALFILYGRATVYEVMPNHQRTGTILFILIALFSYFTRSAFRQVINTLDVKMTEAESLRQASEDSYEQIKGASAAILNQIESLKESTAKSKDISAEVTKAVSDISIGSHSQATDLQDSVMELDELSNEIDGVKVNVRNAIDHLKSREADSEEGFRIIEELAGSSIKSTELNQTIESEITAIGEGFKEISTSVETINAIASQTNLLALNASIESARAGEAGKGFAVVADEIRKLAEETTKSADNVQDIINSFRHQIERTQDIMSELQTQSDKSSGIIEATTSNYTLINETFREALDSIQKVVDANQTVVDKKEQVVARIENIAAIAEEFSANTEEVNVSMATQSDEITAIDDIAASILNVSENVRVALES